VNYTGSCIQDTIDALNLGDRVQITYKSGTVVQVTLVKGDYNRVTYHLGGSSKYVVEAKNIESIKVIERARPKLAVGDKFRYVGQAEEYIVLAANPSSGWVRAIHLGPYGQPFDMGDAAIEKL